MELDVLENMHLRVLRRENRLPETIRFYEQSYRELRNYFGPEHPKLMDLNKVTRMDLYGVMEKMEDRGCTPGGIAAVMRKLRACFNWAAEREL
ncbi:hypothetical protein Dgeo_2105 [Deinococcus geothermalis DSM 11300]|uniref:Core-binding (CB) domain-containing protein n=1 Tax=Deinococcus geothermalis (strain DSM 11300 / CIP 105573 / AG-3a) TaxID=319795 RepID=Q1IWI5_DEIGD|nr:MULTISPECIES: hypothetical protein [Deinococcus]ABF46399.1 hypothetical protein Dgeo_2105 [Deinococcus geothermalis DSM 11300]TDE86917.1 hypothetical protein E0686_04355 [Deinococcus sp. S9]